MEVQETADHQISETTSSKIFDNDPGKFYKRI